MKTNDKNSLKTKSVNSRIAEIHELIEQIRIHLSEINRSDESKSIRYLVQSETHDSKKHLERFEWQLNELCSLFH
jgi:hypothetical protein